jgi:hypothetical protein
LALANLGLTATEAELNLLDGLGLTAGELAVLNPRAKHILFEDFFGTWAVGDAGPADRFVTTAGSGSGNASALTVAASLNGEIIMESATDDGTTAANNTSLTAINLGWQPDSGGLAIEARVKLDVITGAYLFVGFTDVISTTVEAPIFMNAAALDSDAANAFGMVFDTDATTDVWYLGGVATNTDVVPVAADAGPTADTYQVIRVEVSAAGVAEGFIDGVSIGTVASAVTVTTALTPTIVVGNRAAAQIIATVDYIKVEQNRVG